MSSTFLSPFKNDSFSSLRGIDLQELLVEVENYFLEYRDTLNLPKEVRFGVEIEYEGVLKNSVTNFLDGNHLFEWRSHSDGSLNSGGEITSSIMIDKLRYWKELKQICDYLTSKGADTSRNAGGHIHVGACILGDDVEAWRSFLKLYIAYENVLFRFIYGDKLSARKGMYRYAPPCADGLYRLFSCLFAAITIDDISNSIPWADKYLALNFNHVMFSKPCEKYAKNTLELRCPNGSTNEVIWQNNINAFAKMLLSAKDKVMDEEFLNYKLFNEHVCYFGNEYRYDDINLKNVLEFVDLVFDNNLDKVYFLRQYFKNFQESYGLRKAFKAKSFVK